MDDPAVWTAIPVLAWGVLLGQFWLYKRYCSFLVRTAGKSVVGAAALTLAVHVVPMTLFAVTAVLIHDLVLPTSPIWLAVLLYVLAGIVYSPLVGLAMPGRHWPPYETIRPVLEEAGATLGQERAIAWIGGLLSFPGMTTILVGALVLFD